MEKSLVSFARIHITNARIPANHGKLSQCSFEPLNNLMEYSRRGPPSGYLRYVEARATLLETYRGLFIAQTHAQSPFSSPLSSLPTLSLLSTLDSLSTHLLNDSKPSSGTTQDAWDGYREY
jgi:hypothetical protein